jgi:hypothetical protein
VGLVAIFAYTIARLDADDRARSRDDPEWVRLLK